MVEEKTRAMLSVSVVHVNKLDAGQIMSIHRSCGYPGVQYTTYFARKVFLATTKAAVKSAIRACKECQSRDSSPIQWEKGKLEVNRNWQRLGLDITHQGAHHFLTLTNCSPLHLEAVNIQVKAVDAVINILRSWALPLTRSEITCRSRCHRVGVPQVWQGSGD